jgi:hypothetical protein
LISYRTYLFFSIVISGFSRLNLRQNLLGSHHPAFFASRPFHPHENSCSFYFSISSPLLPAVQVSAPPGGNCPEVGARLRSVTVNAVCIPGRGYRKDRPQSETPEPRGEGQSREDQNAPEKPRQSPPEAAGVKLAQADYQERQYRCRLFSHKIRLLHLGYGPIIRKYVSAMIDPI